MKTAGFLLAAALALGSGCAQTDWIDRTLVTVDVTGTWRASGGSMELNLVQEGQKVTGSMRLLRGSASMWGHLTGGPIQGSVAGDVFRFRRDGERAKVDFEGTVSGDEMRGPMSWSVNSSSQWCLRRVDSSSPAISTAYAQDQAAADGPDKIKAMLLRPAGWRADWSACAGSGFSDYMFEARGEEVVVKIQATSLGNLRCERDVTITSGVVRFDGCLDPDITLLFDPNDHDYPFKGKSWGGTEYKFKAK